MDQTRQRIDDARRGGRERVEQRGEHDRRRTDPSQRDDWRDDETSGRSDAHRRGGIHDGDFAPRGTLEDWQQPWQYGREGNRDTRGADTFGDVSGRGPRPGRPIGEPYGGSPFGNDYGYEYRNDDSDPLYANPRVGRADGDRSVGRFSGKGPKGYRRSDDRIREDLCDDLTADSRIDAEGIVITVREGEVLLEGTVPTRPMKRAAEELAERIHGVGEVTNTLRVEQRAE